MILGRHRKPAPRLAAEVDDTELGPVCRRLTGRGTGHTRVLVAPLVQRLLDDAGDDWDRRARRLAVLTASTRPSTQRSWAQHDSRHPDAHTLFAWEAMARGTRTPTADAEFDEAVGAGVTAARLRPHDPNPWVVRLGLLRQRRRPRTEVFPVWREIAARDPWHREPHVQMYGYLSPRECGSHAQSMEFGDRAQAAIPATAPAAGLPLMALIDRYHAALSREGVHGLMADRLRDGPEASRVLDRALQAWTPAGQLRHAAALADLNLLAYALTAARDTARVATVFGAVAGVVTPHPWGHGGYDPVLTFPHAQRRADATR